MDSGHPGPRSAGAVAKALRRPKSLRDLVELTAGGEGEIRTHEPRKGPPVFKTGAFNRSATSPYNLILPDLAWPCVAPRAAHSAHLRNATGSFYNFFVRSLMAHDDGSLNAARVRIDGSGSRDFQRALNSYLRRLMQLADVCIGVMCQRLAFRLTKEKAPFRGLLSCDPAF